MCPLNLLPNSYSWASGSGHSNATASQCQGLTKTCSHHSPCIRLPPGTYELCKPSPLYFSFPCSMFLIMSAAFIATKSFLCFAKAEKETDKTKWQFRHLFEVTLNFTFVEDKWINHSQNGKPFTAVYKDEWFYLYFEMGYL